MVGNGHSQQGSLRSLLQGFTQTWGEGDPSDLWVEPAKMGQENAALCLAYEAKKHWLYISKKQPEITNVLKRKKR